VSSCVLATSCRSTARRLKATSTTVRPGDDDTLAATMGHDRPSSFAVALSYRLHQAWFSLENGATRHVVLLLCFCALVSLIGMPLQLGL